MEPQREGSAINFGSATIALNKVACPGSIDDDRKTFAWDRAVKADVFLAPHLEIVCDLTVSLEIDHLCT